MYFLYSQHRFSNNNRLQYIWFVSKLWNTFSVCIEKSLEQCSDVVKPNCVALKSCLAFSSIPIIKWKAIKSRFKTTTIQLPRISRIPHETNITVFNFYCVNYTEVGEFISFVWISHTHNYTLFSVCCVVCAATVHFKYAYTFLVRARKPEGRGEGSVMQQQQQNNTNFFYFLN